MPVAIKAPAAWHGWEKPCDYSAGTSSLHIYTGALEGSLLYLGSRDLEILGSMKGLSLLHTVSKSDRKHNCSFPMHTAVQHSNIGLLVNIHERVSQRGK